MKRSGGCARAWTLVLALFAVLGATTATADGAEVTHVFDPVLSLTGGCTVNKYDEVADPGCPGGSHPAESFRRPNITIDSFGNMYVASYTGSGADGRIDIFSPSGEFITEVLDPHAPGSIAIDEDGNLYVFEVPAGGVDAVVRYTPSTYKPTLGEIEYEATPTHVIGEPEKFLPGWLGIAVDTSTGHLYVDYELSIAEFGSAEEGNPLITASIGEGILKRSQNLAVDASRGRIYASDGTFGQQNDSKIRVFGREAPYQLLGTIDGTTTPEGTFLSDVGGLTVDVNEATGHVFVGDIEGGGPVYEFTEDGDYVSTIEHPFGFAYVSPGEVSVDNSGGPNQGYVYVPSGQAGSSLGHTYAFGPVDVFPPEVEALAASEVGEAEAQLEATINSGGAQTIFRLEYTELGDAGFTEAELAASGSVPAGSNGVSVTGSAVGLSPETTYRYRATAENAKGSDQREGSFTTYPAEASGVPCPNDPVRIGWSAALPDCRAYELVTPADTNGRVPVGPSFVGVYFPSPWVAPQGDRASFLIEGGTISGSGGSGAYNGETYVSARGADGWDTQTTSPDGVEAPIPLPGSPSPDQSFNFWRSGTSGTATINGELTTYVRSPDGHSEPVGQGALGVDPKVRGLLITAGGGHIVFSTEDFNGTHTPLKLEEDAPPTGTATVYDRTEGVTHVVSLLPGNLTPEGGKDAEYVGASVDGLGIAFSIEKHLYLRVDNEETFDVAGPGAEFAGISAEGKRVFYLEGGDLKALDIASGDRISFSQVGDVEPVIVSADGSRAYFVSPSVLTSQPNPEGASAQAGAQNLYLSKEGTLSFVATVTDRDVDGESTSQGQMGGLGLWTQALELQKPSADPSRTTLDGTKLLFESRANLTGYESGSHAEVYRYDSSGSSLQCLSCNPTGAAATSDASLQSVALFQAAEDPLSPVAVVLNLRPDDGRRAIFQSSEALVSRDTDGLQDVYEWEANGVGSCTKPAGCVDLISSSSSARKDFLYGVSASGDDVFFTTSDILVGRDTGGAPSIYDARVNGGFAEPASADPCLGESCRPGIMSPPSLTPPATPALGVRDNVPRSAKRCGKGKRAVKRHGKVRCVKKRHRRKHHQHRAGTHEKGARK